MAKPFRLIYAPQVKRHVRAIDKKYHSFIRGQIENRLLYEPDVVARNRKPLRQPTLSTWELRFGPNNRFRVFYDVNREAREVYILAIGVKMGHRLIIDNEEIEV